jgi:lipopolysaccharide transport system ATP-binding protein
MNPTLNNLNESNARRTGEVLVKVDGVSKKFCKSLKRSLWYGVQDVAAELNPFARKRGQKESSEELREGEFWAVNDVSFELRRGECLGLIGHNGAGKTTLLKMLNGLIKPDRGHIEMRGRVGALIALGAGFNPVLTGRENIYVNAAILGLSKKEVDSKIDAIIEFAEIGEFIDAPVQSYSSGMQVRLGFAVATSLEPDVLILDEVLAVGDVAFRFKCSERISKLLTRCAVIFVSHTESHISQLCNRAFLLNYGKCKFQGRPSDCLHEYSLLRKKNTQSTIEPLTSIEVPDVDINLPVSLQYGEKLRLQLRLASSPFRPEKVFLRIGIQKDSHQVAETSTLLCTESTDQCYFNINSERFFLSNGLYTFDIQLLSEDRSKHLYRRMNNDSFICHGAPWSIAPYVTLSQVE